MVQWKLAPSKMRFLHSHKTNGQNLADQLIFYISNKLISIFLAIPTGSYRIMSCQPGSFQFRSRIVAIGELHIMAVYQLLSRDGIGTISMNPVLVGSIVCLQKTWNFSRNVLDQTFRRQNQTSVTWWWMLELQFGGWGAQGGPLPVVSRGQ